MTEALQLAHYFDPLKIEAHIKAHHPGCPKWTRNELIGKVAIRSWPDLTLGNAVGITIENYLRHHISGYDKLLRLGIARDDARRLIRPQVDAILAIWAAEPA